MPEITANYVAKNLAELLETIEETGERFTVVRRGKVVAELAPPAVAGRGSPTGQAAVRVTAPAPILVEEPGAQVIDLREHLPQSIDDADADVDAKHRRRFSLRHPLRMLQRSSAA